MPYGKRSYRPRKPRTKKVSRGKSTASRPGWYSKGMSAIQMSSKALALAYSLKSLLNVERKFAENSAVNTEAAYDNIARIALTPFVAQGDTATSRDGRSIKWVSTLHKATLVRNSTTSAVQDTIRILVVKDKYVNNANPDWEDIVQGVPSTLSVNDPRNVDEAVNYQVLFDKKITLTANYPSHQFDFYRKLDMHTKYKLGASGATAADVESGMIYIFYISDKSTLSGTAPPPVVNYTTRARYIDN